LLDHAERNPCWQSTCAAKTVIQVFPLEKLHDQVGLTGVHDAEVERLDDVRKMSQPGRHLGLSAEKRDSLLVQRELARHDLESDLLVEMETGGFVDIAHSALPEKSFNAVKTVDGFA
jgi:hypothetical protein